MTIGVTGITFPSGKNPLEEVQVVVTTDAAFDAGTVMLIEAGGLTFAAPIVIVGLGGTATFPAATLREGSFTVRVLVASTSPVDEGQGSGGPLVIVALDPEVDIPYTRFIEAIRSVLVNSALLPELDTDCVQILRHQVLDRDRLNPGVVLVRTGFPDGGFESVASKLFTFQCSILLTTKANYDNELDDEDRRLIESLSHRILKALEAEEELGGVLTMPLVLTQYDPFSRGRVINATQLWESFTAEGVFYC